MQDIVFQLQRLIAAMAKYHTDSHVALQKADVFPIEVDLSRGTFTYDTSGQFNDEEENETPAAMDKRNSEAMVDAQQSGQDAFIGDLISTD